MMTPVLFKNQTISENQKYLENGVLTSIFGFGLGILTMRLAPLWWVGGRGYVICAFTDIVTAVLYR